MKQYLKMADGFDFDEAVIEQRLFGGCISKEEAAYAARAVVSHDELVQMNQELLDIIKRVIDTSKELEGKVGTSSWTDGYKQCAIDTGSSLSDLLDKYQQQGDEK